MSDKKKIENLGDCKTIADIEKFYMEAWQVTRQELYKRFKKTDFEEMLDYNSLQETKAIDFTNSIQEATTVMSENYDSFNENYDNFKHCLRLFIEKNPIYRGLRNIDKEQLEFADLVGLIDKEGSSNLQNKKGAAIVQCVFEEEAIIEFNGELMFVPKSSLRPFDDYISKLAGPQLAFIYEQIEKVIKFKRSFSITDYFLMFCDYFSVNEKILYQSLSAESQEKILRELNDKTNFLKRKNIKKLY